MVCKPPLGRTWRHTQLEDAPSTCIQTNKVRPEQPQKGMHIKCRFKGYKNNLFDLGVMFILFSVLTTNRYDYKCHLLQLSSHLLLSQQQVHKIQSTPGHEAVAHSSAFLETHLQPGQIPPTQKSKQIHTPEDSVCHRYSTSLFCN